MHRLISAITGQAPGVDRAVLYLRVGVALTCVGYASQMARNKLEINTDALEAWGASPWLAAVTPGVLALALVILGALALWCPTRSVLLSVFGLIVLLTMIKTLQFGTFFGLTPLGRAGRYLLPLGLLLLIEPLRSWSTRQTMNLLRLAIAMTFFGHGTKALLHDPAFIGLLDGSQDTVFGEIILGSTATSGLLDVVGLVDIVVAFLLLATRSRLVPLYMAGWTLMTAASRVLANGFGSWDDIPIRAGYYCIPLAIVCLYEWLDRASPSETRSKHLVSN